MKIKILRQQKNLSQTELAKNIGVSQKCISDYEMKKTEPDASTLIKLAEFFQTTTDNILEHEVPYLLDKSTLTSEQREIIEIVPKMNYEECKLMLAYLAGIRKGIEERNSKFNFKENKYE